MNVDSSTDTQGASLRYFFRVLCWQSYDLCACTCRSCVLGYIKFRTIGSVCIPKLSCIVTIFSRAACISGFCTKKRICLIGNSSTCGYTAGSFLVVKPHAVFLKCNIGTRPRHYKNGFLKNLVGIGIHQLDRGCITSRYHGSPRPKASSIVELTTSCKLD